MAKNQINCYARPQDKYGMLQHMRVKALDSMMMEQLEQILIYFDAYTVLDCNCGDGLYTAALTRTGRAVFAADESPNAEKLLLQQFAGQRYTVPFKQADLFSIEEAYPEKFDAIFCMDNALIRYVHVDHAIIALRKCLNQHGVLIIGIRNWKEMDYEDEPIIPLLLGEQHDEKSYGVIWHARHVGDNDWVDGKYIYYIENPTTGTTTVDWEEEQCALHGKAAICSVIEEHGGFVYQTALVGDQRLYLCGNEEPRKYMGPASYFLNAD